MTNNVRLPLGDISMINKVEKDYSLITSIFGKAGGRSHNFVGAVKLPPATGWTPPYPTSDIADVF
ncbi:MAG: hypothetical protein M1448_03050 [Candidatus Marsarchaeota archaeon]|nr:hypothetical protein [Candidatus Marsarchaeota archaeon]